MYYLSVANAIPATSLSLSLSPELCRSAVESSPSNPLPRSSAAAMSSSYYYYSGRHQPHFLDACSLCGKLLGFDSDIFMYRGNTPFCSNECRQEQIEMDGAEERKKKKKWKVCSSSSARSGSRKSEGNNSGSAATRKTETIAVA